MAFEGEEKKVIKTMQKQGIIQKSKNLLHHGQVQ
jgi:hypothetical protein